MASQIHPRNRQPIPQPELSLLFITVLGCLQPTTCCYLFSPRSCHSRRYGRIQQSHRSYPYMSATLLTTICPPMKRTRTSSYTVVGLRPHKDLIFDTTLKLPLPSTPTSLPSTVTRIPRPASSLAESRLQTLRNQSKTSTTSIACSRTNCKRVMKKKNRLPCSHEWLKSTLVSSESALVSKSALAQPALFTPLLTSKRTMPYLTTQSRASNTTWFGI